MVKAANIDFTVDESVQNVFDVIDGAVDKLPGKWKNILSIHLKTEKSTALPIYLSKPDDDDKTE